MTILQVEREFILDDVNIGRICLPFIDIPFIEGLKVENLGLSRVLDLEHKFALHGILVLKYTYVCIFTKILFLFKKQVLIIDTMLLKAELLFLHLYYE